MMINRDGQNLLGKCWMEIREELRKEIKPLRGATSGLIYYDDHDYYRSIYDTNQEVVQK